MSNEPVAQEREDFIIQNITPGPLAINEKNGLQLVIPPLECYDLTWEDPRFVRASQALRNAINRGYAKKITREQWNKIEDRKLAAERRAQALEQNGNRRRRVRAGDRTFNDVEMVNLSDGRANPEAINTFGYASDPDSYTRAYNIISAEREAFYGRGLEPEEFAEMVQHNPKLVREILEGDQFSSVSGDMRRGRATFGVAPADEHDYGNVRTARMTNLNRDGYIAGGQMGGTPQPQFNDPIYDDEDEDGEPPIAEEYDLAQDLKDDGQGGGSVRRRF